MDITMPHMDGIECVEKLVQIKPEVLILVISALADKATAVEAMEKGANGFLNKPFSDRQLNEALEELLGWGPGDMIDEREIRTFVHGTTQYFEVAAQQPASLGSPYLATQGFPELHEYTGVITRVGTPPGDRSTSPHRAAC